MNSEKDLAKAKKAEADQKRNNQKTTEEKAMEARRKAIAYDEKKRMEFASHPDYHVEKEVSNEKETCVCVLNSLIDQCLLAEAKTIIDKK